MADAEEVEDARGLLCPLPVIRLAARIRRVGAGETVLLLADDPAAEDDVLLWAKGHGHDVLGVGRDGGFLRIRVRRRGP